MQSMTSAVHDFISGPTLESPIPAIKELINFVHFNRSLFNLALHMKSREDKLLVKTAGHSEHHRLTETKNFNMRVKSFNESTATLLSFVLDLYTSLERRFAEDLRQSVTRVDSAPTLDKLHMLLEDKDSKGSRIEPCTAFLSSRYWAALADQIDADSSILPVAVLDPFDLTANGPESSLLFTDAFRKPEQQVMKGQELFLFKGKVGIAQQPIVLCDYVFLDDMIQLVLTITLEYKFFGNRVAEIEWHSGNGSGA